MQEPETLLFEDDGAFPNSRFPLLLYRSALPADADEMERAFATRGWSAAWRDGIYTFHHFHSTAHEVLGIARGWVRAALGGPHGTTVELRVGDVVVIPAGVGHCNAEEGDDLLVVGATAYGAPWDVRRGDPAEHDAAVRTIAQLKRPMADPVGQALPRLWR
jgi:uncharacterized protein YjlB